MQQKNSQIASIAQASLEYLLTYGWALILIATIVGILVLIIATPSGYACSGTGDLICRALGAEGEDLVLSFQNKLPFDIIINPYTGIRFDGRAGYASIKYRGKTYRFEDVTIAKADTFQVTGIGLGNADNISITYKETGTGFEKTWTGNTTTPQKEICNNGISETGDPTLIDCANPECGECKYNDGGFTGGNLIGASKTLNFGSIKTKDSVTPLGGAWEMTEAKVYFNASNVPQNTTVQAKYGNGTPTASQLVITGGNEIIILISDEEYNQQTNPTNPFKIFTLIANNDFTISDPHVMVTLGR